MRSSYDPGNMHFPNPYEGRAPPPGRLDLSSPSQHRPLSHRASSEPTGHELYPPQISPHAMAQPRSIHSPDLFFTRTPTYAAQHVHRARSYTPTHQHAQPLPPRSYSHDQDEYHERPPPVPPHYGAPVRSAPPPPPPPPKPTAPYQQSPYFPSISPTQSSPRSPHPIAPSAPLAPVSEDTPESPTDQDELRQVIELSQQESARRRQYLNELSQQEEDELARALEASKLQSNKRNSTARDHVGVADSAAALGPSSATSGSGPSRPTITTIEVSPLEEGRTMARDLASQSEATHNPDSSFLDIMQRSNEPSPLAEVPRPHARSPPSAESAQSPSTASSHSTHDSKSPTTDLPVSSELVAPAIAFPEPAVPPPTTENQILSDEAFARQLAAQLEQEEAEEEEQRMRMEEEERAREQHDSVPPISPAPPSYNFATAAVPPVPAPPPPPQHLQNEAAQATLSRNGSRHSGSSQASSPSIHLQVPGRPGIYRHPSSDETPGASDSSLSLAESAYSQEPSPITPVNKSPFGSPELRQENNGSGSNNQYLDPELLMGVSIGFSTPMINYGMAPMQGVMPNIISLPYGRCPPLHLQAPSWRHLLKLLARLSGTRIEPTVEAMALVKTPMKLRTVVQFVKPHASARDWRTVLWFTLDHPVPSAIPGAGRYTNGDVSTLPWSYTLSTIPTLLRDGADSHVSKWYTVPSTDATPYPVLPIACPNLALYLQAALDESRRATGDAVVGPKKLARMVESCYPNDVRLNATEEPADRRSMGGRLLAKFGKGTKAKKGRGGGNEETFELVTPFVPDEWG